MIGLAPFQIDQPRRPLGGAPDGVNERKILAQQIVADDRFDVRAMARGERAHGLLKLGRSHVVRRRVDKVARQRDRFDDTLKILAIDALRQIER